MFTDTSIKVTKNLDAVKAEIRTLVPCSQSFPIEYTFPQIWTSSLKFISLRKYDLYNYLYMSL